MAHWQTGRLDQEGFHKGVFLFNIFTNDFEGRIESACTKSGDNAMLGRVAHPLEDRIRHTLWRTGLDF